MRSAIAMALILIIVATPAFGKGLFVAGAGGAKCSEFLSEMEKDPADAAFLHWARGFLSGLNMTRNPSEDETVDLSGWEYQAELLAGYCHQKPNIPFVIVAIELWKELRRQQDLGPDPRFP